MRTMKYLPALVALMILLASCTDTSLYPVFYTLETERSLSADRGLEDEIVVQEIVKAGSWYFAAAQTLYRREVTGNWSVVAPPVAGARCNTLGVYNDGTEYLYAGFFANDGTGLGLYRTLPDTISWTPVTNAVPDWDATNKRVGLIKEGPSELFVAIENNLYYSNSPSTSGTYTAATFVEPLEDTVPITDAVYDGGAYWVIAGPYLYTGPIDNLARQSPVLPADPSVSGGKNYGGLLYSATKATVFLSGENGKLWAYNTGAWTSSAVIEADDDPVGFTRFVELEPLNSDIFVGTQGTGYYRLVGGSISSGSVLRSPAYNISDLYKGAILGFLYDDVPDPDVVFAATYGAGLWRADWDGDSWEWVQE